MSASRYVHIKVFGILKETEKAFLCAIGDEGEEQVWIPLSQISDPDDYSEGDADIEMAVTRWIAEEKELEYED